MGFQGGASSYSLCEKNASKQTSIYTHTIAIKSNWNYLGKG
jgi:hypothetical protein